MSSIPLPKAPGIYQIVCLPTGKFYVGSAASIYNRCNSHRHNMRHNQHQNKHMQHAWNKYGADMFSFRVLELCAVEELIAREQYYLDLLRPYDRAIGFNIAAIAFSRRGCKDSEETLAKKRSRKVSDETKAKLRARKHTQEELLKQSEAQRGRKHSEETKAKIRDTNLGQKRSDETKAKLRSRVISEETRMKLSQARKGVKGRMPTDQEREQTRNLNRQRQAANRHVVICIATGEQYIVHLPTFCAEHNLPYRIMIKTVNGDRKHCQGYRVERMSKS